MFCRWDHGELAAQKWLDSIEKQKRRINLKGCYRQTSGQTDRVNIVDNNDCYSWARRSTNSRYCNSSWRRAPLLLLLFMYAARTIKSNTHRRRRRDSAVELSRVGGVNAPVGSRDPVYNFLCCWAIEVGDKWRHEVIEEVTNVVQHSRVVKPLWVSTISFQIVDRIRRQSSWASCEFMYTPPTRRNSTVESRRRCVLGIRCQPVVSLSAASCMQRKQTIPVLLQDTTQLCGT